jgi:hypothetical protein
MSHRISLSVSLSSAKICLKYRTLSSEVLVIAQDHESTYRYDPYAAIREFWGEDLSRQLARRIENAPEGHLKQFSSFLTHHYVLGIEPLPPIPNGHLRPILSIGALDFVDLPDFGESDFQGRIGLAHIALAILLYAHEVVVDDIAPYLCHRNRGVRIATTRWLLAAQELHEKRLIHIQPTTSIKIHPSSAPFYPAGLEEVVASCGDPRIEDFLEGRARQWVEHIRRMCGVTKEDARRAVMRVLVQDVASFGRYAYSWPDRVHRFFRSQVEHAVLEYALSAIRESDQRVTNVRKLTQLRLPSFRPDSRSLARFARMNLGSRNGVSI